MSNLNSSHMTTTDLSSGVSKYQVSQESLDSPSEQKENYWDNPYFTKWLGFYKGQEGEVKKGINSFATWALGMGYKASPRDQITLDRMKGMGSESFMDILWNMLVMMKINGDSYAEIVRNDKGTLLNIKPLDPGKMRIVINSKGIIERYEYRQGKKRPIKFKTNEIFHLSNDRIGDEIHGTSVIESLLWVIEAKSEAMRDWRRISHRSTIRVLVVPEDRPSKLATYKEQYKDAINNGEVLIIPGKPGEKSFQDLSLPPIDAFLRWIEYLELTFYKIIGIPRIIAGDASGTTEAGGKLVYVGFEPTYMRVILGLEYDIFHQLKLKVTFNRPPSITDNMAETESKNQAQTGFQPNDFKAGSGK